MVFLTSGRTTKASPYDKRVSLNGRGSGRQARFPPAQLFRSVGLFHWQCETHAYLAPSPFPPVVTLPCALPRYRKVGCRHPYAPARFREAKRSEAYNPVLFIWRVGLCVCGGLSPGCVWSPPPLSSPGPSPSAPGVQALAGEGSKHGVERRDPACMA